MHLQLFATVFTTVFIAELGDKTQLATLLYASKAANPKLTVFAASAAALVLSALLGVVAGAALSEAVDLRWMTRIAGVAFIAIGLWTLVRG